VSALSLSGVTARSVTVTKTAVLFDEQRTAGEILHIQVKSQLLAFTWCPSGEFFMGIPDEGRNPRQRPLSQGSVIHTSGFWISSTPVTYAHWLLLMGQESVLPPYIDDYPANGMTWLNAKEYCVRLTAELRRNGLLERHQRI
jgi:formylglycine-generating enzyme required for sulfatase activity